jgi:integrase
MLHADQERRGGERWLVQKTIKGMAAWTRNAYLCSLNALAAWCVETARLVAQPFTSIGKADENVERRRRRRALTEAELLGLLYAARRRPWIYAMMIRWGKRIGEAVGKVNAPIVQLERVGRE